MDARKVPGARATPDKQTVQTLLAASGIRCSREELEQFVEQYGTLRAQIERMYATAFLDGTPLFANLVHQDTKG